MADAILAESYARAIFEKSVEKYTRDLHALNQALMQSNLLTRLDNPGESFDSKTALINGLVPAEADGEVRNLAFLLASKNQMHLLPEVVSEFDRIVARGAPGVRAQVTSAIELTPDERAGLEAKLRKQYGDELAVDYQLDPSILGGVIVRVGDVVLDGSIIGKLAAMKQKLATVR
ncbi:MAG TPA: ATP synthase F1 subunit delta [Anaerolineae bacterium]|nr:ATP synthase F1 subunit delta [Anaerolineae bacterium]